MSEDFGKWLKEAKFKKIKKLGKNGELKPVSNLPTYVVSVRALGEWAWGEYESIINPKQVSGSLGDFFWGNEELYEEIAVACLGKKEIKKRLKKINHSDTSRAE